MLSGLWLVNRRCLGSKTSYRRNSCLKTWIVYIWTSCRAVVVPKFGGPDVLEQLSDVEVPPLQPKEVLVRAISVSINPLDIKMRSGYGRSVFEQHLPVVLGRDISGVVADIGSSVKSIKPGQEVFGALHPTAIRGTYTDFAILDEEEIAVKPASLSHMEASAIPFASLTAWRALKCTARITDGQRVLVIGGGGAVGLAAIQISVTSGCHVTATCGHQSINRVLEVGAETAVDHSAQDTRLKIKGKFDAVLDTVGAPETERIGIDSLKRGGHYMTLQGEAAALADAHGLALGIPMATALLLKKQFQYRLSHGIEYSWTYMRADMEGLYEIQKLCAEGKLKIPVEKAYPLARVVEAHKAKENNLVPGKVVLKFD